MAMASIIGYWKIVMLARWTFAYLKQIFCGWLLSYQSWCPPPSPDSGAPSPDSWAPSPVHILLAVSLLDQEVVSASVCHRPETSAPVLELYGGPGGGLGFSQWQTRHMASLHLLLVKPSQLDGWSYDLWHNLTTLAWQSLLSCSRTKRGQHVCWSQEIL